MGVAMAGMLVPRLNVFWDSGWEVIFAAAIAWFGGRAIRGYRHHPARSHRAPHDLELLLASGAMLYMLMAASARSAGHGSGSGSGSGPAMAMAGPSGSRFPTLALVLALGLFGYVIWTTDKLTSLAPVAALAAAAAAEPAGQTAGASAGTGTSAATGGSAGTASGVGVARVTPPLSPRLAACCEIVMGVTMGYVLITML